LKDFEAVNIDALSSESLKRWNKWIGGLDATFDRATRAIDSGRRLLTKSNLIPLAQFTVSREESAAFEKFMASLPTESAA
jgi:hypothetical protein